MMEAIIRVLYVDDEPDLLDIGKLFLEESGDFTVTTAMSAAEGILLLDKEKFDAIVSDYQMPGMDGIQFLIEVRSRFGPIPFILFTGRGREEIVIQALNSGADFYLQKGGEPGAQFAELTHKIKIAASSKRADDALRKSEEKYRHLIEHSNEAIVVAQDGMLKLVNHRMIEFTGYSEQELLSRPFSVFIHPDDRAIVVERYQKRLEGEEPPSHYAFRLSTKDASLLWVEISVVVIEWDERPATLNFLTDITDRKRTEDALLFTRHSIDSATETLVTVAKDGHFVDVNDAFCRTSGYSRDELLTMTVQDIDPDYNVEMWSAFWNKLKQSGTLTIETTHRTKEGKNYPVETTLTYFEYNGNEYHCAFAHDITRRKRAEAELVFSEKKFAAAFEASPDPIAISEIQTGKILDINRAFEDWSGYLREEMSGKTTRDLNFWVYPEERDSFVGILNTLGYVYKKEVTFRTKQGEFRNILFSANVLETGNKAYMLSLAEDITERKVAEEALRKSEQQFRALSENSQDYIMRYDKEHRHTYANPACLRAVGMTAEQFLGKTHHELGFPPDLCALWEPAIDRVFATGQPYSETFAWTSADGEVVLDWQLFPEKDDRGCVVSVLGVSRDITERKLAEDALADSEEVFREVFNNASEAIFLHKILPSGLPGNYFKVNDIACKRLGYLREELFKMSPLDIVDPQHLPNIPDIAAKVKSSGYATFEGIHRRKDGSTFPVEVSTHIFLLRGEPVGLSIARDITKRKRAKDELCESEERYNSLFTNNYSISLLIDPETGKIEDANAAACRYYGYSPEQLVGMGIYEINRVDKEKVIRNLKEAKKKKERHFFSTHFLSDGKQRNVEIYSGPILVNGKLLFYSIIHDVTDRVKAEEELKNSRRFIDHTLTTTPALIYIYDVIEGRNVYTNRGIFEALGYTPEEISAMGQALFSKILHPDDAGPVGQHHARFSTLPDSTVAEIEYRMKHADGSWRWLHSRDVVFLRTPDGAVKQILGSSIDITEHKLAEEALKKSEEKYRMLIEQTDEGVWIVGSDYKTTFVNNRLAAMFGYTPQEMIGKPVQEFMPAEDLEVHSKRMRERQEGKGDRFEQKYFRKDGSVFWVIALVTPLLSEENRFDGAFAMLTDITERKATEEALQESEERYRAVADFTYDWEHWMAIDGKFVYVSPSCERITGYRPEEFILNPNHLVTITHADDRDKIIEHLAVGHKLNTEHGVLEFRIITRNGEERWIGHECQPVFNTNGGYLGRRGSNRDITKRKRAEENLIATITRSREQQEVLGTISFSPFLLSGDVQGLSAKLTEVSSAVLGVDRVSVWLFNNNEEELRCIDLYEVLHDRHSYEGVLKRHEYENEFDALSTAKYIDAHDSLTDPRTAGYVEDYLKPNRITSMLDAVIRVSGQNLGVLCFEHVDRPHHWESDEIAFACQLADQIAITLLNRDRKRAEEALRESEERYRNVVEDQTEFICRFLPGGTHIFVNDAYCRYFDKKREEIIGHRFRPLLHPDDREMVARHLASLTPEHPVRDIDQRIIMPDDSHRWQRWSDRAIFDPNGRVIEYQSVGRDITEQKELEKEMEYHAQELRKYSTSLAVANKKLNLLSSITRHDINNQMTVLQGYLAILKKKQPDPALIEYFLKAAIAAQRISSMIQFTKEYENIGVTAPVWQDCCKLLATAAKQAPLGQVIVKNDFPAGGEIFADPLIVKVFYNLMDNAVRYGAKISTIRLFVEERNGDPIIVCEDDGDGVVAEEKEKIFERGFGKNTGLGLFLAREILDITGITIKETGEPGKGARFEITVPKGAWRMTGKDA